MRPYFFSTLTDSFEEIVTQRPANFYAKLPRFALN